MFHFMVLLTLTVFLFCCFLNKIHDETQKHLTIKMEHNLE
jgi:hypothetical protein